MGQNQDFNINKGISNLFMIARKTECPDATWLCKEVISLILSTCECDSIDQSGLEILINSMNDGINHEIIDVEKCAACNAFDIARKLYEGDYESSAIIDVCVYDNKGFNCHCRPGVISTCSTCRTEAAIHSVRLSGKLS